MAQQEAAEKQLDSVTDYVEDREIDTSKAQAVRMLLLFCTQFALCLKLCGFHWHVVLGFDEYQTGRRGKRASKASTVCCMLLFVVVVRLG